MDVVGALKTLQLFGCALGVGGAMFLAFVWQPEEATSRIDRELRVKVRILVAIGALSVLVAGCADLLRLGAAYTRTGPVTAVSLSVALDLIRTPGFGQWMLLRAVMGLPIMAVVLWRSDNPRLLVILLALALMLPISMTGHSAASGGVPILPVAVDVLHLLLSSAWFGGLVCLLLVPWQGLRDEGAARTLIGTFDRFSNLGLLAMGTLGLTGLFLVTLRLYGVAALIEHPYGQTLAWKLALVATLLVPAAINLLVIRPRLRQSPAEHRPVRLLQGLLAAELIIGMGILCLAGLLSTTSPPLAAPAHFEVTLQNGAILPQRLEIPRNQPVLVTITNKGTEQHTFSIHNIPHVMVSGGHHHGTSDDLFIFVEPGKTEKAQFIALRPGTYVIYCMLEHHMDQGEKATLVVQP